MFFLYIEDFERVFKLIDRLNILTFNVWRDKNAESFKSGYMNQLECLYRSYISEMREKSNEMLQLKNMIDQQMEELNQEMRRLDELSSKSSH